MYSSKKDNDILSRVAKGDKKAFDVFFESYYPKLINFAVPFTNSVAQAEDVVSEVLTNILVDRKRIFSLNNFNAYLYTAIKNKALTHLRKQHQALTYSHENYRSKYQFVNAPNPHELLVENELKQVVSNMITQLPDRRKTVFHMIKEDGLSYKEVAQLLDISERTVEVHLKLAVRSLRECIAHYLSDKATNTNVINLVKTMALLSCCLSF